MALTKKQLDIIFALSRSNNFDEFNFPLTVVSKSEIVDIIVSMLSNITKEEANTIIDNMTISYSDFGVDDQLIPSSLLLDRRRINVSPIIKIGEDKYIYGNEICKFSHKIWTQDIFDGDFPYRINNKNISNELDKIHKLNSDDLEIDAEQEIHKFLEPKFVIRGLKKFHIISNELPKDAPCGEIDILCINPENNTIYVLEAKAILQKNRPYNVNLIFRDFFGAKGKRYYIKLNKKYDFVKEHTEKFVTYFGLDISKEWKMKKAFIVNQPIFAAYHTGFDVAFVRLSELKEYINRK